MPFKNSFQVLKISSSGSRDGGYYMSKKLVYARGDMMSVVFGDGPKGGSQAGEVGVPQKESDW